jgi:hypothetical protein
MNPHERRLTDAELETIGQAVEEYERLGKTEIKCPRCGKAFLIHIAGNSFTLRCESSDCIKMSLRGI